MKGKNVLKFSLAFAAIITGLLLNQFNIGNKPYLGFASAGSWLVYIGILLLFIAILRAVRKKERLVDERMLMMANKANRIVFLSVTIAAFIIMVLDGISTISIPLGMFMAYLICGMMIVYFISYEILLKYN